MKDIDVNAYLTCMPKWAEEIRGDVKSILLHSGNTEQRTLLMELFPKASITSWEIGDWNLNEPCPEEGLRWDLFVTMNTFLCSPDPERWFKNVFAVCKYAWIQDIIKGWRSLQSECATEDGDLTRFSFPPEHVATWQRAFDMTKLADKTVDLHVYSSGEDIHKNSTLSFVVFLNGLRGIITSWLFFLSEDILTLSSAF